MVEDPRTRWITDEELDALLPSEGYIIVTPPEGYAPVRPARKMVAATGGEFGGFMMQDEAAAHAAVQAAVGCLTRSRPRSRVSARSHSLSQRTRPTLPRSSETAPTRRLTLGCPSKN